MNRATQTLTIGLYLGILAGKDNSQDSGAVREVVKLLNIAQVILQGKRSYKYW